MSLGIYRLFDIDIDDIFDGFSGPTVCGCGGFGLILGVLSSAPELIPLLCYSYRTGNFLL